MLAVSVVVMMAVGPFHVYDFVLLAASLPYLFRLQGGAGIIGVSSAILLIRSETLFAFMFPKHDPDAIFPGSGIITIGALLLMFAFAVGSTKSPRPKIS